MISFTDKSHCCGCESCVQRCPKQCIELREDSEGFLYPFVRKEDCVDCHLCERVCPVLNPSAKRKPLETFAAINPDSSIRSVSSSGGVFTALALSVLRRGGVVFGACFDENWNVVHGYTETEEGLARFRGSKYVQSRMGSAYHDAERFLKSGRQVLFSGTPCQILGLRRYLRKAYENLFLVDFICHGVPSPGVWRMYLKEEIENSVAKEKWKIKNAPRRVRKNTVLPRFISGGDVLIAGISFRDKSLGWKKFSFALVFSTTNGSGAKFSFCSRTSLDKNLFMRGFLADLYLRPSCYSCPARGLSSGSDITLGDFWGVWNVLPSVYDDHGTSVALVHTSRTRQILERSDIHLWAAVYADVLQYNPAIERSPQIPKKRVAFFAGDGKAFSEKIQQLLPVSRRVYAVRIAFSLLGERRVGKFIRFIKKHTQRG